MRPVEPEHDHSCSNIIKSSAPASLAILRWCTLNHLHQRMGVVHADIDAVCGQLLMLGSKSDTPGVQRIIESFTRSDIRADASVRHSRGWGPRLRFDGRQVRCSLQDERDCVSQ